MVRIAAWLSASVFVAVAAIATVGFVQDARMQDAPTASECVDDWNARSTGNAQRLVATERYSSARVSGWFHDYAGCGVTFDAPGEHPFLILTCSRGFSSSDPAGVGWTCEWDTPLQDAPVTRTVARVDSGWRLTLT